MRKSLIVVNIVRSMFSTAPLRLSHVPWLQADRPPNIVDTPSFLQIVHEVVRSFVSDWYHRAHQCSYHGIAAIEG